MKILMVGPSVDNGYWKKLGKRVGPKSEPLNLLYIATFLNNNGHEVTVLDCEAEGISIEELAQHIRTNRYDVVGVSMLTPLYTQAVTVCKLAKKINPRLKVIIGGSHPTLLPGKTVGAEDSIDVEAIGEAEVTFLELLESFQGGRQLKDISGIAYRENGHVVQTPARGTVKDLDFFPLPDRSLINMKLYRPSVSYYRKLPAYTMITTRGCPYRCTFCATANTGYRMHSVERVIQEMKLLVHAYGAKEILFRDDTFTLKWNRIYKLCDAIIAAGLHHKVKWDCITRANLVDLPLLTRMKQAGCWGIHFGVEGGTQALIDGVKKDTTLDAIERAFQYCKQVGIETRGYFIIGMPGSRKEDDLATIAFAKKINPDWAQFTICTPYPGTEMYQDVMLSGGMVSSNWDNYQTWSGYSEHELVWTPEGRDSEELKYLQRRALREFYFRPGVILRKLTRVHNFPIFRKYLLGAIALTAGGNGRPAE